METLAKGSFIIGMFGIPIVAAVLIYFGICIHDFYLRMVEDDGDEKAMRDGFHLPPGN